MIKRTRGMLKRMENNQKYSDPLVEEGNFNNNLIFDLDKPLQ